MPTTVAKQTGKEYRDALEAKGWLAPTPRYLYDDLVSTPGDLADLIVENWELRRAQMMPRDIVDHRMLRLYDPETLQDHWSNPWTGTPLKKLSRSKGKAIEIFPWAGSVGDTLISLMSGRKPFSYAIDVEPNDATSDADAEQADAIEGLIYREQVRQRYPLTYQDGVGWTMLLGRGWKSITVDTKTRLPITEVPWPGHVAAFWQEDMRTLEQAIVQRNLTLGEAVAMYAPNWRTDEKDAEMKAAMERTVTTIDRSYGSTSPSSPQRNAHVTLLTCTYRMGDGKYGEQIDQTTVLMGSSESDGKKARAVVVDYYPNAHEERGDGLGMPLYCTPRVRIIDKPPDEATGFMSRIAGGQVWYNEVLSSSRDMLSRTIYPRLKAIGFSFRNAPRFIERSAMYALPREGQDIKRIEETLNIAPLDEVLTRLEENVLIHGGLNRIFLQAAPTSQLSGDAIDAALSATSGRHEVTRTEIGMGELWVYSQWLANLERWKTYEFEGKSYPLSQLIGGKRDVVLYWQDMIEIGKVRRQQMMLAASNAGKVSDDSVRDVFGVRSKLDEVRKIRKERGDPILHPEHVSQTAAAIIQMAEAKQAGQGGGNKAPQTRFNISLAGAMSPEETASAAALAGIQGAPPSPADVAGGTKAIPGRQPVEIKPGAAAQAGAVAAEAARTAAARAAPPSNVSNNQPGGAEGPAAASQQAPLPPTQPSNIAPTARPGGQ